MRKAYLVLMSVIVGWQGGFLNAAASQTATADLSAQRTTINRYCITCHNERLKTAGLLLDKLDISNVPAAASPWEKVVRKLRSGAMPPVGAPRPDKAAYGALSSYLESELDRSAEVKPNPGNPMIHRLNRTEYANAVRDILAIDLNSVDVRGMLPSDESEYGFDNVAEVLTVSPVLMERYLSAAKKVSRLAVGDPSTRPYSQSYDLHKFLMQDDRMSEDLPFGSRGGIAVKHYFPVDGEYEIKVRLQREFRERVRGLAEAHQLDLRLDGKRLQLFTIGGVHLGKSAADFTAGQTGDPEQEHYELYADEALQVRIPVKAGTRLVQVAFLKETYEPEGPLQHVNSRADSVTRINLTDLIDFKGGNPAVDSVRINGPFETKGASETPSRKKIFLCRPATSKDEETCARKVLTAIAHRAYRRPIEQEDIEPLVNIYRSARRKEDFDSGIETAIARILAGPEFLFRIERDPSGIAPVATYRISDLDLASRLSFFLWSSVPDDELLGLAEKGKLKDPATLERQMKRMLADDRSKALIDNFASEWLHLGTLESAKPDPEVFAEFDRNLQEGFAQETKLFVESMVREDRPLMDLLTADYTFANERLAHHYGIPGVYGSHFRRVSLNDDTRRGLLGQGSILTVTSYANRTAPTIRGKWILENVLGAPPPPPPPNVPSLKENKDTRSLSMRQRMEQHRANPACAVCHAQMDPLGFALENFDGIGQWRNAEGRTRIDSSGVLPDGTKFAGSSGLREILASKRGELAATITEKLMTYALGRGVEYYDQPVIRKVLREAEPNDYRWSSIFAGIVRSMPFQMRRASEQ